MCIAWPKRIKDAGGIRNQFHHVIDIVPTMLEATGIAQPEMVDGTPQKPIEGVSMAYTFDKANANDALAAHDAVLRDAGRSGDLPRRLDRQHDAPACAVEPDGAEPRMILPTASSGSCTI